MDSKVKNIIIDYIEGDVSHERRKSIGKWIAEDRECREFYIQRLNHDAMTGCSESVSDDRVNELYDKLDLGRSEHRDNSLWRVAVTLLKYVSVAAITVWGLFGFFNKYYQNVDVYGIEQFYANHITTSYGQTQTVTLPDGSKVQLNANSSLAYSDDFEEGGERIVLLSGEALFDVAQNKSKPFIVNVNGMCVKVLGTVFNVDGYNNASLKTTLVSGSVKVANNKGEVIAMLEPGEQLTYDNNVKQLLSLDNVDTERFTSWSKGYIRCRNTPLLDLEIMLENAYNVDIKFADIESSKRNISGTIYFNVSLYDLIEVLKTTYDLHIECLSFTDSRDVVMIKSKKI